MNVPSSNLFLCYSQVFFLFVCLFCFFKFFLFLLFVCSVMKHFMEFAMRFFIYIHYKVLVAKFFIVFRVWFRISVRIRAGGQFSSEAIFLEPFVTKQQNSKAFANKILHHFNFFKTLQTSHKILQGQFIGIQHVTHVTIFFYIKKVIRFIYIKKL